MQSILLPLLLRGGVSGICVCVKLAGTPATML